MLVMIAVIMERGKIVAYRIINTRTMQYKDIAISELIRVMGMGMVVYNLELKNNRVVCTKGHISRYSIINREGMLLNRARHLLVQMANKLRYLIKFDGENYIYQIKFGIIDEIANCIVTKEGIRELGAEECPIKRYSGATYEFKPMLDSSKTIIKTNKSRKILSESMESKINLKYFTDTDRVTRTDPLEDNGDKREYNEILYTDFVEVGISEINLGDRRRLLVKVSRGGTIASKILCVHDIISVGSQWISARTGRFVGGETPGAIICLGNIGIVYIDTEGKINTELYTADNKINGEIELLSEQVATQSILNEYSKSNSIICNRETDKSTGLLYYNTYSIDRIPNVHYAFTKRAYDEVLGLVTEVEAIKSSENRIVYIGGINRSLWLGDNEVQINDAWNSGKLHFTNQIDIGEYGLYLVSRINGIAEFPDILDKGSLEVIGKRVRLVKVVGDKLCVIVSNTILIYNYSFLTTNYRKMIDKISEKYKRNTAYNLKSKLLEKGIKIDMHGYLVEWEKGTDIKQNNLMEGIIITKGNKDKDLTIRINNKFTVRTENGSYMFNRVRLIYDYETMEQIKYNYIVEQCIDFSGINTVDKFYKAVELLILSSTSGGYKDDNGEYVSIYKGSDKVGLKEIIYYMHAIKKNDIQLEGNYDTVVIKSLGNEAINIKRVPESVRMQFIARCIKDINLGRGAKRYESGGFVCKLIDIIFDEDNADRLKEQIKIKFNLKTNK